MLVDCRFAATGYGLYLPPFVFVYQSANFSSSLPPRRPPLFVRVLCKFVTSCIWESHVCMCIRICICVSVYLAVQSSAQWRIAFYGFQTFTPRTSHSPSARLSPYILAYPCQSPVCYYYIFCIFFPPMSADPVRLGRNFWSAAAASRCLLLGLQVLGEWQLPVSTSMPDL